MTNALRSELRKLRHTRSLLAILLVGLVIAAFGAGLLLAIGTPDEIAGRLSDHGPLRFGPTNFGLLLLLFGVRLHADETQHRTITSTYVRTPDRRVVLAAKAAVAAGTAVLFTIVVYALVVPITVAGLALRDLEMTYDVGATAALGGRVVVAMVLLTLLGLAVGVVLGNRTVALVAVVVWFALAESVVGGLLRVERFLPGSAVHDLVAAEAGRPTTAPAAAVILAVLVTGAAAAALVAARRDVA
jgi:ABC-type transport system involved in multi-copper enzyme maturation permease subunit